MNKAKEDNRQSLEVMVTMTSLMNSALHVPFEAEHRMLNISMDQKILWEIWATSTSFQYWNLLSQVMGLPYYLH